MNRRNWLLALALFLFNLWMVHELLGVDYLVYMGSIEGSRIALGRWIMENWQDLSWFPLWYGGVPFPNTYPPLCPALMASIASLANISPAHSYHVLMAGIYALGPVALFWLALHISRSRACSLASALFYSLISPSAFLISEVSRDLGSVWHPRRLQCLIVYGEGPHVMALTLLPLALLLLFIAWGKRRPVWWMAAVLATASVILTNWLGATELILAVGAWLLSTHSRPLLKKWLWTIGVAACAAAVSSPWIPPRTALSFLRSSDFQSGSLGPNPGQTVITIILGLAGLIALLWAFRRFQVEGRLRFVILFLYAPLLITLSGILVDPQLVPHRIRFHLIVEMGVALAAGLGLDAVFRRISPRQRIIAICLLIAACVYPGVRYRSYVRSIIRPVEIGTTIEYREAKWLEKNLAGDRVFVSGSTRFFLNAFADVPQFGGGFEPGSTNPLSAHVQYQVLSGANSGEKEGEVAVLWLRALGVGAIAVGGPDSREYYREYRNPSKFCGLLPELWSEGDDVIYGVPRRSASLAHVIRRRDLPARRPENGIDVDPVRTYVTALETRRCRWQN